MDYHDLQLLETSTVRKAMEQLDKTGKRVLFVTKDQVPVAALSDGDIRRWILSGGSLGAPVSRAAMAAAAHNTYIGLSIIIGQRYNFFGNTDGLFWFIENCLDSIDCKLRVVGNGMDLFKDKYPEKNVEFIGFVPDLSDKAYTEELKNAMQNRVVAVEGFATKKEGYDKLPDEALAALKKLVEQC